MKALLSTRLRARVCWIFLGVAATGTATYSLLPAGSQRAMTLTAEASTVMALVAGVLLNRPVRPGAWLALIAAQSCWLLGDIESGSYRQLGRVVVTPTSSDPYYLAAYALVAVALVLFIRQRGAGRDLAGLLDTMILTAGIGLLGWVVLARPSVLLSSDSLLTGVVALAYPVGDVMLAGLLIRLVTTWGPRPASFRLVIPGVALLLIADTCADAMTLAAAPSPGILEVLLLASSCLLGAAALHPSMRTLARPGEGALRAAGPRRFAAMTVATLVAPGTLAVELLLGRNVDGWAVVAGSVVMFLLAIARMNVSMDQIVSANRQRERLQEDLAHQAAHDSLTGLPNRAHALRLIDAALSRASRSGAVLSLLFIDLDDFKDINDTYGHRAGDEVLCAVSSRMHACVRAGDVVARLGGDEFVVLLDTIDSQASVVDIAERIVASLSAPIALWDGHTATVGASVGVALNLDGATDASRLLTEADAAVYRAKACGRGRVEIFDDQLRHELSERAALEAAIISGIRDGEFVVHYQPVVDVANEQIQGYEALVRWDRPDVGLLGPAEFIPTAEASTLICELDRWVLREALVQLAAWDVNESVTMAVNISGRHMASARIIEDVRGALDLADLPARRLVLEITETILIDDPGTIGHLQKLRAMGVIISIDDFGTGYNSIAQLQHLPVDVIKIDRSFLAADHPAAGQLFELIVQAAHAFGKPVVAEGVERADQMPALRAISCESAQGFFFARPLPASDLQAS
ncbi:MAG: EAL domain-containing protein, partial [Actinobacteria bacterium]|nr:EAL domain-containing protein [Actinomycetota bacterium]